MRYNACVISRDHAFSQFVRLTLLERVRSVAVASDANAIPEAERYVVDLDTVSLPGGLSGKVLCCSATMERPSDFSYLWADRPFRPARLLALLDLVDEPDEELSLVPERHAAMLAGEEISLSVREYELLVTLLEAGGEYLTREELLHRVWGEEESDQGVVNVYIHYLRRKLERGGQRFLLSARGRGYAIAVGRENS
jgi:hypothetical protein